MNQLLLNKIITQREKDCLNYLARGMTAKAIAKELGLSPRTVESYIEKMRKKYNCSNRIELVTKLLPLLEETLTNK